MDIAIRMGKGDWEGLESRYMFADELIVVAAPHYNGGSLPATPQEVAAGKIIFSMESWKTWCLKAGLEREIVADGLCINDSNLVLEAVRLGNGIALERRSLVQGAIDRGELVQLTACSAPYPWPYWLVTPQQSEKKAEVSVFMHAPAPQSAPATPHPASAARGHRPAPFLLASQGASDRGNHRADAPGCRDD